MSKLSKFFQPKKRSFDNDKNQNQNDAFSTSRTTKDKKLKIDQMEDKLELSFEEESDDFTVELIELAKAEDTSVIEVLDDPKVSNEGEFLSKFEKIESKFEIFRDKFFYNYKWPFLNKLLKNVNKEIGLTSLDKKQIKQEFFNPLWIKHRLNYYNKRFVLGHKEIPFSDKEIQFVLKIEKDDFYFCKIFIMSCILNRPISEIYDQVKKNLFLLFIFIFDLFYFYLFYFYFIFYLLFYFYYIFYFLFYYFILLFYLFYYFIILFFIYFFLFFIFYFLFY